MSEQVKETPPFEDDGYTPNLPSDEIIRINLEACLEQPSKLPTAEHRKCREQADRWVSYCKANHLPMHTPYEVE